MGTLEQPIDFPDLEAFAQNNFSKELDDLERVLSFFFQPNEYKSIIDVENISLIGHSRGGGIVLIKAEEDARIKKVISWASVRDFKQLFQENLESFLKWKTTGRTYVENVRTNQLLPHDWQFYEDFKLNEERLTIERAVSNLSKPQLIIHGLKDPTVSASEARLMHQWNPNSQLELITEGDHVFGSSHPFTSAKLPADLKTVVARTIEFIVSSQTLF